MCITLAITSGAPDMTSVVDMTALRVTTEQGPRALASGERGGNGAVGSSLQPRGLLLYWRLSVSLNHSIKIINDRQAGYIHRPSLEVCRRKFFEAAQQNGPKNWLQTQRLHSDRQLKNKRKSSHNYKN